MRKKITSGVQRIRVHSRTFVVRHLHPSSLILQPSSERGVALILTLGILVLVTMLVIAFAVSMRVENTASKNFNDLIKARQLAQGAVEQAVALLRQGTPLQTNGPPPTFNQPTTFWTAPGLALTNFNGTFGTVLLYSTNNPSLPNDFVNLNAGYVITGTNSLITSAHSAMYAGWNNVGTNGQEACNGCLGGNNNPIIGRFAFWVDDEATKVNINSAWRRDTAGVPPQVTSTNNSLPSEIDLRALEAGFFNNGGIADNIHAVLTPPNGPWFTTPQEVRAIVSADDYQQNRFSLTTYSSETNVDTWGRPRIDLNSIATPAPGGDAYERLKDPIYQNIYPALAVSTTNNFEVKYGSATLQQILANIIDYRQPALAPPTQDAPNMLEIPRTYCGLKKGPYLNEIIVHVMHTNEMTGVTGIAPKLTNWTVHIFAFVDVELINPFADPLGGGYEILVEPNSISYELYRGQTNTINQTGPNFVNYYPDYVAAAGGPFNFSTITPISKVLPPSLNIPGYNYASLSNTNGEALAANWQFVPLWQLSITYVGDGTTGNEAPGVTNIIVDLKRVLLRRVASTPSSIQDWATSLGPGTFKDPLIVTNPASLLWNFNGSVNAPITDWLTTSGAGFDKNACGLAKNDPRMRTFELGSSLAATTSWYQTAIQGLAGPKNNGVTPNQRNAGGIVEHKTQAFAPYLLPDGKEAGTLQHLLEPSTFYIKEANFESPGELGYIHSGVPWRTLRMQSVVPPINSIEASSIPIPLNTFAEVRSIPDWIMLDIFTAGSSPTVRGRLNINASIFGTNDFNRSLAPPRTDTLAALFYRMFNTPLNYPFVSLGTVNFWWGTNVSLWAGPSVASPYPSSTSLDDFILGENITRSHDTNLSIFVRNGYFSTNNIAVPAYGYNTNILFLTPGEICEIGGIDNALVGYPSTVGPRKADKELMIRKIANLITTRSNAFTIWATAQTIIDVNKNGVYNAGVDIISGEARVQAVVERYVDSSTTPPTVKFRTKYLRYIYD